MITLGLIFFLRKCSQVNVISIKLGVYYYLLPPWFSKRKNKQKRGQIMCPQMYSLPMGELECEHMVGRLDTSHFHLCTAWGWAWTGVPGHTHGLIYLVHFNNYF